MEKNNSISGRGSLPPITREIPSRQLTATDQIPAQGSFQDRSLRVAPRTLSYSNYGSTNSTRPSNRSLGVFESVPQDQNHIDAISKKITHFKRELKKLQSEQEDDPSVERDHRIFILSKALSVLKSSTEYRTFILEKVAAYRNALLEELKEQLPPSTSASQTGDSLERHALFKIDKFQKMWRHAETINKIADHILKTSSSLLAAQADATNLERYIDAIAADQKIPRALQEANTFSKQVIEDQKNAIIKLSDYAKYFCAYHAHNEIKTEILNLAEEHYSDYRRENPSSSKTSNWFFEETTSAQEAQTAMRLNYLTYRAVNFNVLKACDLSWEKIRSHPSTAKKIFEQRAATVTRSMEGNREDVIKLLNRSADSFQQAATSNDDDRMALLDYAGRGFLSAAQETEKSQPRGEVINLYTRSADSFQQAADSLDQMNRVCLKSAAETYLKGAREAELFNPNWRAIDFYTFSADSFQQAAVSNNGTKMICLKEAAEAYLNAAQEAIKPERDEKVISSLLSKAKAAQEEAESILSSCTIS